MKPGEKSGASDPGFFAWEPSSDPFTKGSVLDLRYLNESHAGVNGHIRRKGNNFVLGDGSPVRFWGVNVNGGNSSQERASIDYLARKLAKLGVNMVRFHSGMFSKEGDPAQVDKKALDNLHYLISAMKREGIYTKISFYFPLWFHIKEGYGIEGYDNNKQQSTFYPSVLQPPHAGDLQILGQGNPDIRQSIHRKAHCRGPLPLRSWR